MKQTIFITLLLLVAIVGCTTEQVDTNDIEIQDNNDNIVDSTTSQDLENEITDPEPSVEDQVTNQPIDNNIPQEDQSTIQLTDNDLEEYKPKISGDKVVFYIGDRRSSEVEFYLLDISTKETTSLTTAKNSFVFDYDFEGNNVVWAEGNDLYVFNINTKKKTKLETDSSRKVSLSIYGDYVVWHDDRNIVSGDNYDIYSYNLKTNQEKVITDESHKQMMSHVSSKYVVWEDNQDKTTTEPTIGSNIYISDLNGNNIEKITSSMSSLKPFVTDQYIFYGDFKNNANPRDMDAYYKYNIYAYNINSKNEKLIYQNSAKLENEVFIDGSDTFVAWEVNSNVNYYDLTKKQIHELSEGSIDYFSLDNDKLIIAKKVNGKTEVFLVDLNLYDPSA